MSASVASWSWQCLRVCVCVSDLGFCSWAVYTVDVRGGVCKVLGVSVCVFLLIRHDREGATHSSCSAKSSHFVPLVLLVGMLRRPATLATLASPATPACPAGPAG